MTLSGRFSKQLDLTSTPNCVYRPERFSGAVSKHRDCTVLLLSTGSFVCLGSTSKRMENNCAERMAKFLNVEVAFCITKNIVMSHTLDYRIDMRQLYNYLRNSRQYVSFDDEIFNGIVWKEGWGTVRLFHTGRFLSLECVRLSLKTVCDIVCNVCNRTNGVTVIFIKNIGSGSREPTRGAVVTAFAKQILLCRNVTSYKH